MIPISRRQLVAILLVLVLATGAVAAATALFSAGAGTSYETDSGLLVGTSTDHAVSEQNPFVDGETVQINNVSVSSSGPASVTIDQFEGSRTNLSSIDTTSNAITVDPQDKSVVTISGGVTALAFEDARLDGSSQMTFSADGAGSITVTGLPAETAFAATTSSGEVISTGTTSTDGTATIEVDAATDQEIILLEPSTPVPDESRAQPADGTQYNNPNIEFSVPVNDSDFDSGDEVEARFFLDGEQIATDSITSNGTVSAATSVDGGGQHTWHVELVDKFGRTSETNSFDFDVAAELHVFNESEPTEFVDEATVDVTFYGTNTTVTRSASNGKIDFSGLPLDEEFTATISADGYRSRTVDIPSLIDQQSAYLLPENATAVQVRFELDDVTGTFNERSYLYIEKPITKNGTTEYEIIVSDQFGTGGVATYLEQGVRYELRVVADGTTAQLGAFDAEIAETVVLQPSAPAVQKPEDGSIGYDIGYDKDSEQISVEYVDPAEKTDSLTVSVVSRDGETVLKHEQTYNDANALSLSIPTNGTLSESYYVYVNGTRDGQEINIQQPVGPQRADIDIPLPDDVWVQVLAAFAILLVGGIFSMLNVGVGAVVTSLFGGVLWYFGFLGGLASGGAVALAIGLSTLHLLSTR